MTMTRANVVTLATNLSLSEGDATTLQESFDDTLERLAKGSAPFANTEAYTPTDGTSEYAYPTTAVTILAVFHGARQLGFASSSDLEAYEDGWRSAAEGTPYVFTYNEQDARKVKLFPTPATTAADGGTFLFSENRTTDIPDWLTLMIAFEMLFEEFSYPSDHQDQEMANACAAMGKFLRLFTGVL